MSCITSKLSLAIAKSDATVADVPVKLGYVVATVPEPLVIISIILITRSLALFDAPVSPATPAF